MTTRTPDTWFKSSWSKETQDCVEVNLAQNVGVRDTKNRDGGQLDLSGAQWTAFVTAVRNQG